MGLVGERRVGVGHRDADAAGFAGGIAAVVIAGGDGSRASSALIRDRFSLPICTHHQNDAGAATPRSHDHFHNLAVRAQKRVRVRIGLTNTGRNLDAMAPMFYNVFRHRPEFHFRFDGIQNVIFASRTWHRDVRSISQSDSAVWHSWSIGR